MTCLHFPHLIDGGHDMIAGLYRVLKYSAVKVNSVITNYFLLDAYKAAVALYEATFDRAHYAASSQQYKGHDHAGDGGAGLHRSMVYSEDGGADPLFTLYFSTTSTDPILASKYLVWDSNHWSGGSPSTITARAIELGNFFCSPKLNGPALSGWICYEAIDGEFEISFHNMNPNVPKKGLHRSFENNKIKLEQTSTSSPEVSEKRWLSFYCEYAPGEINYAPFPVVVNLKEDTTLKVYSLILAETTEASKVRVGEPLQKGGKP